MSRPSVDYIINECTCGRRPRDYTDLAVIIEEDGVVYKNSVGKKGGKSKVVCLRKGCVGTWKSKMVYASKLPRILNIEYIRMKQKEKEE
jgi:hypothetical protein